MATFPTSRAGERYAPRGRCQGARCAALPGVARFQGVRRRSEAVGRRGVKEYRAPEALALIAADREHVPLVCPSCGTHASYIERGQEPPRDETMDPRTARW